MTGPLHVDGMRGIAFTLALVASQVSAQAPAVWRLTRELRIGSDKGEQYEFALTPRIAPAADGSIYVMEPRRQDVRVFDARGGYVRTIGRRGGGPGEFQELVQIGALGDTLWTIDFASRRVSLFAAEGELLGEISREAADRPVRGGSPFFMVSVDEVFPDGIALGRASYSAAALAAGQVPRVPILVLTRGGRTRDTLAWLTTKNSQMAFKTGERQLFSIQRFSDTPLAISAPAAHRLLSLIDPWLPPRATQRFASLQSA